MIYVLGLGNVLMGDDGFGPAVVREFDARYVAGSEVKVVDIGTPGLDLTPWLADAERVILVDTVKTSEAPGTIRLFDKDELLRHGSSPRTGPHDPGVKEALVMLDLAGRGPCDVALVGIVPQFVGLSLDLTPAVLDMVPAAADLVASTLRRFGAAVQPRAERLSVPPWWAVDAAAHVH